MIKHLAIVYFCRLFSEPDILVLDSPESCSKTRPAQLMEASVTAVPDRCGECCVVKLNILTWGPEGQIALTVCVRCTCIFVPELSLQANESSGEPGY